MIIGITHRGNTESQPSKVRQLPIMRNAPRYPNTKDVKVDITGSLRPSVALELYREPEDLLLQLLLRLMADLLCCDAIPVAICVVHLIMLSNSLKC